MNAALPRGSGRLSGTLGLWRLTKVRLLSRLFRNRPGVQISSLCARANRCTVPATAMAANHTEVQLSMDYLDDHVVGETGGFFCCGGKRSEPAMPPPDEDFHCESVVRLPHGYTAYRVIEPTNPVAKPPPIVVMLHGMYNSSFMWSDLSELMAEFEQGPHARVLVYDYYGRGRSPWTGLPLSLDMYVTQLKELLDALKFSGQPVSLIGYDLGGAVAAGFAAKFPHLCLSMTLLSTAGVRYNSPFQEVTLNQKFFGEFHIARQKKNIPAFQRAEFFRDGVEEPHSYLIAKQVGMAQWQLKNSPGYLGALLSTFRNFPLRYMDELFAAIGKHPRRVLIVCGSRDAVAHYKKCTQILEECFPRAEMVDVMDCGHHVLFEKFDEVTTELLSFHREVVNSFTEGGAAPAANT